MDDKIIRLECIRTAGGDIKKAKQLYAFMTEKSAKPTKKAK
jgi:hypothetical protein